MKEKKPEGICLRNGCDKPSRARGLCPRHYARNYAKRMKQSKTMKGHPFFGNRHVGSVKLPKAPELASDETPRLFSEMGKKRVFILEVREVFE